MKTQLSLAADAKAVYAIKQNAIEPEKIRRETGESGGKQTGRHKTMLQRSQPSAKRIQTYG